MSKRLFGSLLLASATAIAQTTPEAPRAASEPVAATRTARERARDSFVILDCVPMVKELQQFSTGTIATATSNCVEQGRYGDAARLFLLTTIDARFDAERLAEPKGEDVSLTLDRLLRAGHTPAGMDGLARARRALMDDLASRRALCAEIRQFGPPDDASPYRDAPTSAPGAGRAGIFDAERAWATVVATTPDCRGG